MTRLSPIERSFRQTFLARLSDRFRHHVEACIDLRGQTDDPLHATYLCPEGPFLIEVPGMHCRGLHSVAFPMDPNGAHPFIRTVRAIDAGLTDYQASPLCAYYARYRPETAAAALGLDPAAAHTELMRAPLAASLPWDHRSPAEAEAFWTMICERDYRAHGFGLDFSDGWKAWGPLTDRAGKAEFTRLVRAYHSIRAHGYLRHSAHDGDIMGTILRHADDTRIMLDAGQHRAAVLTALGRADLPVRLTPATINRADVAHWPNVRRGIYTERQALQVFDRVFAGHQPFDADA